MESVWYRISDVSSYKADDPNAPEGAHLSEPPRRLTPDEIDTLLDFLPSVECSDPDARKIANASIRKSLKDFLIDVYLSASQFDQFREDMVTKFSESRIMEGENVGVLTADALGESSTQVALNTFHVGGAATAALVGIEGLKSLIFAYQPKNKSTIIHLTTLPQSFDEALSMRKHLEGVSLGDLIIMKESDIDTYENLGRPDWYDYYELLYEEVRSSPDTMIMRIKLRLDKLLYFEVTMTELFQTISAASYGNYNTGIVNIVYSPLPIATIDLHLVQGRVTSSNPGLQKFSEISFFRNIVVPVFGTLYIRGVPTIKKVYPVSSAVWEKSISVVRPLYQEEIDNAVKTFQLDKYKNNISAVELNFKTMTKAGVSLTELFGLLDSLGLQYSLGDDTDTMLVYNPFYKDKDKEVESVSTFIRERKSGLPYIKDQNILEIKTNKYVKYAGVRIYQGYIYFDKKYIKYVLLHLKKHGFIWDMKRSTKLWRKIEYVDSKPVEVLDSNPIPDGHEVTAYLLIKVPSWYDDDITSDDLSYRLNNYYDFDVKRVFFYVYDHKTYIYYHPRFESELMYHLGKAGYSLGGSVQFKYDIRDDDEIIVTRIRDEDEMNTDYLKLNPKYTDRVRIALADRGYDYGDNVPYTIRVDTEHNVTYQPSDEGQIPFYILEIPTEVRDNIIKKLEESDEFDNDVVEAYRSGKFDNIDEDMIEDVNNAILERINEHFRKATSAQYYDHWFLTSKDQEDKRFNIYDTLSNPYVDPTRTYNNDMKDIAAVLGVEAAYSYFIKAMKDLNEASGNYIDSRHILLIADFIFSRGRPNGVLFAGLSRQPIGHLSLITVERAMEVLRKLAFTKSTEGINTAAVAISTGQNVPIGSGMFRYVDDPSMQRKILKFNNKTDDIRLTQDEMSDVIKKMKQEQFGSYEPEKLVADLPGKYAMGKTYKHFADLFNDVMKDRDEFLGMSDQYIVKILPVPSFNIPPMRAPDKVATLLTETIELVQKEEVVAPKTRTVSLAPKKKPLRRAVKKPVSPGGPASPTPAPPKPASPSIVEAESELPSLDMSMVLAPADILPDEMTVSSIDISKFESGL